MVRWGMIGCGDVAEVKAGPGLQKATGSALAAVMRRDYAKARDFAARHGVERVHARVGDEFGGGRVHALDARCCGPRSHGPWRSRGA